MTPADVRSASETCPTSAHTCAHVRSAANVGRTTRTHATAAEVSTTAHCARRSAAAEMPAAAHRVRRSTAAAAAMTPATSTTSSWSRESGTGQNGSQSNDAEDLDV